MHPMAALFLKLTALVAIVIVAFVITGYLLKILIVAAVIAAVLLGGYWAYSAFRRRFNPPVIR